MLKIILLLLSILGFIFISPNYAKALYTYESVSFEVALSKIMVDSGLFSEKQNKQILEVIKGGYKYPDISSTIKPFNSNGNIYQYYGFFKKAYEYEIVEYDVYGVKNSYKLIDNINLINPKTIITKAQFDKLAFVAYKMNPSAVIPFIGNGFSSIIVKSTTGNAPLVVNFKGDTTLLGGGYTYEWDFGDGSNAFGKNVNYVYVLPGTYKVMLSVRDSKGNIGISTKDIVVLGTNSCKGDTDGDLLNDCKDACPLVFGDKLNSGCPILEISKPSTKNTGYECSYDGKQSVIYGHSICNICPCDTFTDFNADVRKCDLILPALISPDGKEIYSKGNYFQVMN